MSTGVQQDYQLDRQGVGHPAKPSIRLQGLIVVLLGCAVMAASGGGLARYLDTASSTAADAGASSTAPLG